MKKKEESFFKLISQKPWESSQAALDNEHDGKTLAISKARLGVRTIMVVFGAIYHWYPLITGRHLNQTLGKIHFWVSFIGAYAIYFPMHYLGFI